MTLLQYEIKYSVLTSRLIVNVSLPEIVEEEIEKITVYANCIRINMAVACSKQLDWFLLPGCWC